VTTIEATCPTCGTVERRAEDFELSVCSHSPSSWYAFLCPECERRVQKPASEKAIELLISEGVAPRYFTIPAEVLETHDGPPLTVDDLIELHELLEREDWYDALVDTGR